MRWFVLFFALWFCAPQVTYSQAVVKRSGLTVTLDGKQYFLHTVGRKQTLFSIAAAYGVTQKQILERNRSAENGIKVGQTLLIADRADQVVKQPKPTATTATPSAPSAPAQPKQPSKQNTFVEPPTPAPQLLTDSEQYVLPPFSDQGEILSAPIDTTLANFPLGLTAPIKGGKPLRIAMLLPFGGSNNESSFVDFLRGATIALEKLKERGAHFEVDVISTSASPSLAAQIINQGQLENVNLIIGPVYSEVFEVVATYAAQRRIPIISPLGGVGSANHSLVVEVAPAEENKWDKVASIIASNAQNNIIVLSSPAGMDSIASLQIEAFLPQNVRRLDYLGKLTPVTELSSTLDKNKKNVFVIPFADESLVENILSRLSSINTTGRYDITVVGTPRWSRFNNMNLEMFFKLGVVYPTTYFFDRADNNVAQFFGQYVSRYNDLPTLYSFRGYDVVEIFGTLLFECGEKMMYDLVADSIRVLQTPYEFSQQAGATGKIVNTQWALICYKPSFEIEVR